MSTHAGVPTLGFNSPMTIFILYVTRATQLPVAVHKSHASLLLSLNLLGQQQQQQQQQ